MFTEIRLEPITSLKTGIVGLTLGVTAIDKISGILLVKFLLGVLMYSNH